MPSLEYFGNRIIAMVVQANNSIGSKSQVELCCNIEREVCPNKLAPSISALAIMAMIDTIAVYLIKARDFKATSFDRLHLLSMLGRRLLLRVGDALVPENLPLIDPSEKVRVANFCMASGRFGLAIIAKQGRLIGILTAGDLHRALIIKPLMITRQVRDFVTSVPVTIYAGALVSDAELLVCKYKIRALVGAD